MFKKTKRLKLVVTTLVMFSMVVSYGSIPAVKAATLAHVKDLITDSRPSTSADHEIVFQMGTAIEADGYYTIEFGGTFGDVGATSSVACQGGVDAATSTNMATCTYPGGLSGWATTTISGITNPSSSGIVNVTVTTYQTGGIEIEQSVVKVYIVDAVTVSATVDASLTFSVGAVNAGVSVNGINTTATSTATTTPFGNLDTGTSSVVAQLLTVATNATDGYSVTVENVDGDLETAGGATINNFNNSPDNTGSTTPEAWVDPTAVLNSTHTYGHWGLTTEDTDLKGGETFAGGEWAGLNGTAAMEIMSHTGASAAGSGTGIGTARVAYRAYISELQEAGDYEATLVYIVTPSY